MQQRRGLAACTAGLLVLMQAYTSEGLRLAFVPDPEEAIRHQSSHELPAFASGLRNLGHEVDLLEAVKDNSTALDALLGSSVSPEDAFYDVVLTQGAYNSLNDRWPVCTNLCCCGKLTGLCVTSHCLAEGKTHTEDTRSGSAIGTEDPSS